MRATQFWCCSLFLYSGRLALVQGAFVDQDTLCMDYVDITENSPQPGEENLFEVIAGGASNTITTEGEGGAILGGTGNFVTSWYVRV